MLVRSPHQRLTPVLMAGAVLCACGEPGVATPMPEPPTIDLGSVAGREYAAAVATDRADVSLTFEAGPGATTAGALVRATNLDGTAPPTQSFARDDGSFAITVLGSVGQTLRLQAIFEGLRGPPVDLDYAPSGFTPVTRPDCVGVSPELFLTFDADGVERLRITNNCDVPITVENPRSRLGLPDFTLDSPLPNLLGPGVDVTLPVGFQRSGAGERDDVLFVDVTGTEAGTVRYPITVTADAL